MLGIVALIVINHQLSRGRRLAAEQTRPHVGVQMEPHAAEWHVIELVVRNFCQTAANYIRFSFASPSTVAEYENSRRLRRSRGTAIAQRNTGTRARAGVASDLGFGA